MTVEIKNNFVHIWTNAKSPVLFARVYSLPVDVVDFNLVTEEYLGCIRKLKAEFPVLFTVTDFSELSPPKLPVVIRFYEEFIPAQLQLGIRYKAFVRPRNLFSQFALEDVIKNSDPVAVGVFDTFEEAMKAAWSHKESDLKYKDEPRAVL
jgi:hypothetical protein